MSQDALPMPKSYVAWLFESLGFHFALLLPGAALLAFILTLLVLVRGNRHSTGAALCFIVPLPLLVGIFAMLEGLSASFTVIAMSSAEIKASELVAGLSQALVAPKVGLLLMAPSFVTALLGLTARSLVADQPQ